VKAKSSRRLRKDTTRQEDLWNPSEIVDATSFLISYIITSLTERQVAGLQKRRAPCRPKPARVPSSRTGKHRSG